MFIAPLHLSLCQVYGWGTLKINADTSFILRKLVDMQKKTSVATFSLSTPAEHTPALMKHPHILLTAQTHILSHED